MRRAGGRATGARIWAVLLTVLIVGSITADRAMAAGAPAGTPTAHRVAGNPTVGPLFADGLGQDYVCTASVVSSPAGDLILTAAHCLNGTAVGWQFAPAYDHGRTPYGAWTVVHAYLPRGWLALQNPRDDFAVLQLAKKRIDGKLVGIQSVTGANTLGYAPKAGSTITDVAYNSGSDGHPIACTTTTYRTGAYSGFRGFPSFNCHGYTGGSSGSPWLATVPGTSRREIRGMIGGLHQGGCYDYTSYSTHFGSTIAALVDRAVHRQHPDVAPAADDDGC